MRCPNCNRFVSFEQEDPEVEVEVQGQEVTGSVRLVLKCAECGEEMKDADLDISINIEHTCDKKPYQDMDMTPVEEKEDPEFEIIDSFASLTDRYQTTFRERKTGKIKPIKSFRYQKHFYGAEVVITLRCSLCEEEFTIAEAVEEQASGFNELV